MKHIMTLETRNLCDSAKNGGCGECQTSCQSACKTSCGIANRNVKTQTRKTRSNLNQKIMPPTWRHFLYYKGEIKI